MTRESIDVRDEARQDVQQVVSRTLRDSLGKLQRTTDELNQAVNDLVAACASTRPSNSLPSMLRAQTSAASLAASLEVLSRFVATSLQPSALRFPVEDMSSVSAESATAEPLGVAGSAHAAVPAASARVEVIPERAPIAASRIESHQPSAVRSVSGAQERSTGQTGP